jgi:O-antigen/teichoic acid export membrane protein
VVADPTFTGKDREPQRGLPSGAPADDLKRKSVRGGAATLLGQCAGMSLQIGTTVVLARLLSPTDYGLQSMVFTLTALFSLFKDAGLSVATVQRDTLTEDQISTLFWINLALGTLLTTAVAASSWLLAAFYKEPRLIWLTIASASIFLFDSLAVQHKALLDRAMRFSTSVKIGVLSMTIGSVVAIVMAALGCGYWSLICQNISIPIVGTIATWVAMPWVPGRPRWTSELRSMLRFGGTVTLNGVVVYVAYNTEKILLGRFWGAAPLGIYTPLPIQQLIGAVHIVAFSVLSRMQDEVKRLERAFLKSLSLIVSLTVPVVISTALFSDEIVLIVLGPKWTGVSTVLRLLSPTVLVFALINPFSWFLRATGRVGRSLKIAFLICPVVILGILVGLRQGPPGVAIGYSTAMVLLFVPVVAWEIYKTGITTHDYWDAIKRPLISGIFAGIAGWLAKFAFRGPSSPETILFCGLTVSFAVYAGTLLFVMGQKYFYVDLLSHLFRRNSVFPAKS